jgi:ubiquinone/menaquinone biosynthesis C-methylase UbiE
VLQHLAEPKLAIKEFQRVCRPGGYIFLCEPDRGTLIIHSSMKEVTRKIINYLDDVVISSWIGRSLVGILQGPTTSKINVDVVNVIHVKWADANHNFGFEIALPQMVKKGIISNENADLWLNEQKHYNQTGGFFCMASLIRCQARMAT